MKVFKTDSLLTSFLLMNNASIYKINKIAAKYIASLIKDAVSDVSEEEYRKLMLEQYKKLYLIDDQGNWQHEELAKISDSIMPVLNKEAAYSFIDEITVHVEENPWLMTFISEAIKKDFPALKKNYRTQGKLVLSKAITYGIAIENLTKAQNENHSIIKAVYNIWKIKRSEKISLKNREINPFSLAKLATIEGPVKSILKFHETGIVDPKFFTAGLPINILEAMMTDFYKGNPNNAIASWSLTVNKPTHRSDKRVGTGPTEWSKNGKIVLIKNPLNKAWNDLYQTWNMAFCSQFGSFPFFCGKLLIPSVNNYKNQPDGYLYNRILSLFTHLNSYFLGNVYDREHGINRIEWADKDLTKFWGKMNREFAKEYSSMVKEAKNRSSK